MKQLFLIFFTLLLFGCATKNIIVGNYFSNQNDSHIQLFASFKPDSLLELSYWSSYTGNIRNTTKWYLDNDTVYTSITKKIDSILTFRISENNGTEGGNLIVYDLDDSVYSGLALINCESNCSIDKLPIIGHYNISTDKYIERIIIRVIDYELVIPIFRKIKSTERISVFIKYSNASHSFYFSDRWYLKGKRLLSPESDLILIRKN